MTRRTLVPVMRPQLPPARLLRPYLDRMDASRIYSNWGPLVGEFEARLARHLGLSRGAVVTASSGTQALVGAVLAGAGPAKRKPLAIVPGYTFVATASAVEACGYECFIADIDERSWMLDPQALIDRLDRKVLDRTGVIVPVAPFGRPVPQAPWREFQRKTGIPVVIDGAAAIEAAMARPRRYLGELPVVISLHATKSLGVGEGGAVVCTRRPVVELTLRALNYGFLETRESRAPGTNGKLSEYHAAVGLAGLDGWYARLLAGRLRAAARYRWLLEKANLADRLTTAPDISSTYVLFRCTSTRETARLAASLAAHGVDSRHWYGAGLHRHAHYAKARRENSLAVTERLARTLTALPMAADLSDDAIARVARALKAACVQG